MQKHINIGTPNGQDGDFVRDAMNYSEDNFTELYNTAYTEVDVFAEWSNGLTFEVSANVFPLGTEWYSATAAQLTLTPADGAWDRIDLFVADIDGTVKKITGQIAGATPPEPNYDFATQYPIKFVLVKANQVEPNEYENKAVFNEDLGEPNEWLYTPGSTDAVSLANAHSGAKSIEGVNPINEKITHTTVTPVVSSTINLFSFWIILKEAWDIKAKIYVDLYNTSGSGFSAEVPPERIQVDHGKYGFDGTNSGWQKITIDFSTVITNVLSKTSTPTPGISLSSIDKIEVLPYKTASGSTGWFYDEAYLQISGIVKAVPTPGTSSLINDGKDGSSTYVEDSELGTVAKSNEYADLNNKPINSSDFINNGADGTSTFAEHDELGTAATSNDYNDLDNKPVSLYLGLYVSLGALQTAHATALTGNYANVDTGIGSDTQRYLWDVDDTAWVLGQGDHILNTQELVNDGADGSSTYAEHDELGTVATTNDYNDLSNIPAPLSTIKEERVTLIPTVLKDLLANPASILPTPAAGKVIKLLAITGFLDYNSIPYDFIEQLEFRYETSGILINVGAFADWNGAVVSPFDIDKTVASGGNLSMAEGIVLGLATTNATVGDSDIKLVVLYSEQDFNF